MSLTQAIFPPIGSLPADNKLQLVALGIGGTALAAGVTLAVFAAYHAAVAADRDPLPFQSDVAAILDTRDAEVAGAAALIAGGAALVAVGVLTAE